MRIIFDRSAFHGDCFDDLIASPLGRKVAGNRVTVFHTPIFIDETLSTLGSSRAGDRWRDELKFCADICNGGVFLTKDDIWHNELVCGDGPDARRTFPDRRTRRYERSLEDILETLRTVAATDDLSGPWEAGRLEREKTYRKKDGQHGLFREARTTYSEKLRLGANPWQSWAEVRRTDLLPTGRSMVKLVSKRHAAKLADIWAQRPDYFPFYTAFIEGMLYSLYYAMTEQNSKLDRNAQADYEQLAYLVWADVIVSNDQSFLTKAFDAIWRPRGKHLYSSQQFTGLLRELSDNAEYLDNE